MRTWLFTLCLTLLGGALVGCGDDTDPLVDGGTDDSAVDPDTDESDAEPDGDDPDGDMDGDTEENVTVPTSYLFESRFNDGESSINHGGQTTRHVLIADLDSEIQRIDEVVRGGTADPTDFDMPEKVLARLNAFFVDGADELGERAVPSLAGETTLCQSDYTALSGSNLLGKLAGEDDVTDHRDWDGDADDDDPETNVDPAFSGFASEGSGSLAGDLSTPKALIEAYFNAFAAQVSDCSLDQSTCPVDGAGEALPLYVTPEGHDLAQLINKTLRVAIAFHQAADDYLDDDVEGKGLLADNTEPREEGAPDTALEHAWDEGFGYFGAAANYADYTDEEIRAAGGREEFASGYNDLDGDMCIDLFSEFNFAASTNAAKRDLGSTTGTDLTTAAIEAFIAGRHHISTAGDDFDLDALKGIRDEAVSAWEQAIAATAIHYFNDTMGDMSRCGTDEYSMEDHAKHWSELKGFALAFQFNPRSPVDADTFAAIHDLIGDAPVLCDGDLVVSETNLTDGRNLLGEAFGFDSEDVANW